MKVLSLKLQEEVFEEVEEVVKDMSVSRNAYINDALRFFNKVNQRKMLRKKLAGESKLAAATSLEVLAEMEAIEDEHYD